MPHSPERFPGSSPPDTSPLLDDFRGNPGSYFSFRTPVKGLSLRAVFMVPSMESPDTVAV